MSGLTLQVKPATSDDQTPVFAAEAITDVDGLCHTWFPDLHPSNCQVRPADPDQMKHEPINHRRGSPVGYVSELPMLERGFVLYLRLWCSGRELQQQVAKDFIIALGEERAVQTLASFSELCDICLRHGRRPLMHYHVNCKCLGADESCLANFIATATEGEREDAMFIATVLVRPDMTPMVTALAQNIGLAIKQMLIRDGLQTTTNNQTLH